ncbi:hypothetical protein [Streptomyces sp. NBC_00483]|uniref:hypothetical protein n=1 Tax=Streptomyces sp. NBC_00483 TaxID=2975756 RepID=UPI002E188F06
MGGGPGVHARWLVEDGYRVHLVDPVERHVREAAGAGCTVHRAEDLAAEVRDAGVIGTRLYGVEGPGDALLKAAETATGRQVQRESDLFTSALAAARMAEEHPELLVASSHLLAFGRRPGQAARS